MTEAIVGFFESITQNDYLTLFLVSIIPVIELRGALILSAGMDVQPFFAFLTCIAGSSIVIIPLLLCIKPIIKKLKQTKFFHKLAVIVENILADKAEKVKKSSNKGLTKTMSSENKKFLGLMLFVSIPLPLTGAWTGSGIGAALDFKIWKAALAIFIGNIIAAAILSLLIMVIPIAYIDIILYAFLAIAVFSLLLTIFVAILKHKQKFKHDKMSETTKLAKTDEHGNDILKNE